MEKLKLTKCWKTLLLLIGMSLFSGTIFAQSITVHGHVVDEKGEPLIGASVKVKSSPATATTTNISGDFSLRVPSNTSAISISYVGFVTFNVAIKPNSSNLGSIPLANDANSLTEVVVVGYGSQNKRDVTGATVTVDAKSLSEVPSSNVIDQLKGKVAGVDIVNTNGALGSIPSIRIRGNRTIGQSITSGQDAPLLVVDGVPYTGGLNDINPEDIKSLEILKDASATAIYGSRGANGVILVTTNRGRAGKLITSFNAYYGAANVIQELPVMNGAQYAQFKTDAFNGSKTPTTPGGSNSYPLTTTEQAGLAAGVSTDWQKLLYQTGYVADQNVGISGGNEATTFNIGAGYRVETSVEPNQRLERYSLQTVIDHRISKAIRIGVNTTNTLTYNNAPGGFQGQNAAQQSPLAAPFNPDGSLNLFPYVGQTDAAFPTALLPKYNPAVFYNNTRTFHNFTNLYAEVTIFKDLKYKLSVGYDFTQSQQGQYNGVNSNSTIQNQTQTTAQTNNNEGYHYTLDNLLTYDKTFGQKHHVTFVALFSAEKNHIETSQINGTGIPEDINLNTNLGLASTTTVTGGFQEYGLVSEMARLAYSYDNRFALTGTIRQDGSSELATGHKYNVYPAGSAAWTVTNEKWMQPYTGVLDNLKVRFGYGVTSNGGTQGPYQTLGSLTNGTFEYGGVAAGNVSTVSVTTLVNNALHWQNTGEYNLGFDFGLFKDRLTGTIDVYSEKTTNIILNNVLPASNGAGGQATNLGTSAAKGLEIALSSINIQNKGGFSWTTDFNIAFSRERIVSLPNGELADVGNGEFVGWPLTVIYDAKKIGIWQTADVGNALAKQTSPVQQPGEIRVQDVNGDGIINATDRQIVGTFQPQYTGGITNRFTYKNFDLSIVVSARMGMDVLVPYLATDAASNGWGFFDQGRHNQVKVNYWTPTNPTNAFPQPNMGLSGLNYASTEQYQDGSFIRVRSINLGYTIPARLLARAGISSLRVYANCTNPFFLYDPLNKAGLGYDPEGNSSGGSVNTTLTGTTAVPNRSVAVSANGYPTERYFNLGVNLKF